VTRLVFDRTRATGIEIARGSVRETIRAERGVLLCAAPDRAAQLLLLSGVGPADHLRAMGVGVVADRPGVGRNLHDHVRVPLRWQATPAALDLPESSVAAGMFTVSLNASPPDLQMDFVEPRMAGASLLGIDVTLVQPSARGDVRLRSADPLDPPVISTNVLGTDADLVALVQGVRLARLVGESPQLDRMRSDEREPSRTAQALPELRSFVRATATARGHLAGTCAMGRAVDPAAVVDATLSVHGVQGLRVAGAAVMPVVVNAPPAAAALMIGDRAGEWAAEPAR
jgi:choline dehydrogenase